MTAQEYCQIQVRKALSSEASLQEIEHSVVMVKALCLIGINPIEVSGKLKFRENRVLSCDSLAEVWT
jgi:hypothetical protein